MEVINCQDVKLYIDETSEVPTLQIDGTSNMMITFATSDLIRNIYTAKCKNLSIATGHAMMGLSLGPITGQLMSELLDGRKPSIDLQLLNPDRYA